MKYVICQCDSCIHRRYSTKRDPLGGLCCDAFPDGIPGELFDDSVSHKVPYEGDGGIMFEIGRKPWPEGEEPPV